MDYINNQLTRFQQNKIGYLRFCYSSVFHKTVKYIKER